MRHKNKKDIIIKNRKISLMVTLLSSLSEDKPACNRSIEKRSHRKQIFMVTFKEWGSTVPKLQSHYEEIVYVLSQSPQKFLIPI